MCVRVRVCVSVCGVCLCMSVYLFLDSCELLDSDDESVCVCV